MSLLIYNVSKESSISITDVTYHEGDVLLFTGTSSSTQIRIDITSPCTILLYDLVIDLSHISTKYPIFIRHSKECSITFLGTNLLKSGPKKCSIRLGSTVPSFTIGSPSLDHKLTLDSSDGYGGITKYITSIDQSIEPMDLSIQGGTMYITSKHAPGIGIYYQNATVASRFPLATLDLVMLEGDLLITTEDVPCIGYHNGNNTDSTLSLTIYHGTLHAQTVSGPAIATTTKSICNITVEHGSLFTSNDEKAITTSSISSKKILSGSIFIEEHSPKCGDTLHGIMSDISPNDATYDTQWIRIPMTLSLQEEVIVSHSSEYTLTADDVDYLIFYRLVGTSDYEGTLETHVGPIPKIDSKEAPARPFIKEKTQTTIEVELVDGLEYAIRQTTNNSLNNSLYQSKSNVNSTYESWQTSSLFTNLSPDSQYQIIARYEFDSATQEPSEISRPLYASTLRSPFCAKESRNKIYGLNKVYSLNDTIEFRAQGTGVNLDSPMEGDSRYIPCSYTFRTSTISWMSQPYLATLSVDSPGDYTLFVTFQKQQYLHNAWTNLEEYHEQSSQFTVLDSSS